MIPMWMYINSVDCKKYYIFLGIVLAGIHDYGTMTINKIYNITNKRIYKKKA